MNVFSALAEATADKATFFDILIWLMAIELMVRENHVLGLSSVDNSENLLKRVSA